MANALVQFRIDNSIRQQASDLCAQLGFDLSTYLRMSLIKLVQEQGVPFNLKLNTVPTAEEAIAAMKMISDIAQANGTSEFTLDEINAEIAEVRKHRKKHRSAQ